MAHGSIAAYVIAGKEKNTGEPWEALALFPWVLEPESYTRALRLALNYYYSNKHKKDLMIVCIDSNNFYQVNV